MKKTNAAVAENGVSAKRLYLNFSIAAVLFCLCYFVLFRDTGILSQEGRKALSVFVMVLYLWIFEDTVLGSLIGMLLLVFIGSTDYETASFYTFGHYLIPLGFGCSAVGMALSETGVLRWVARWMLSRKFLYKKPYVMFFVTAVVALIMTMFSSYFSAIMICLGFFAELRSYMGIDEEHSFNKALIYITNWVTPLGTVAWPFGKGVPLATLAIMCLMGLDVDMVDLFVLGFPLAVLGVAGSLMITKFVLKPDVSCYDSYDAEAIRQDLKNNPITKRGKAALVIFVIQVFCFLGPSLGIPVVSDFMIRVGTSVLSIACLVLCCYIVIDGKPLFNIKSDWAKLPWSVGPFVGVCFLLVGMLTTSSYGVTAYVASLFAPLANACTPIVLVIIGLLICLLTTNFVPSTVCFVVVWVAFSGTLSANGNTGLLVAFGLLLAILSSCNYAAPSGSLMAQLLLGKERTGISIGEALPYNMIMVAFIAVVSLGLILPLSLAIF